ncbi:alpha/beta fold hydrolase [Alteromonas lipolytica]|uniref:AB hydrolase-1 domain-containing protein n=1 Tax=Alteromonas lipolytica TaxID=1856405 RepID=A0A1E8FBT5_9ALTE|nr:alpha/beta fold hydrolase [Alteromonas lipolytica]OFI33369.1 hypothetical protein BFC17_03655 [Alteromonas lipolytica]GGF60324.1 esterase [Alteromonas lipolytica]
MNRRHFLKASALATSLYSGLSLASDTPAKKTKPVFVLVHGSFQGGWAWQDVKAILQARGYCVYTPTCTGCGERVHLSQPDVGLNTHIDDIANVIKFEELDNIILAGHSYSGLTITGVADRYRDKIKHLVYFDALIPREGVMSGVMRDPVTGELPASWLKYAEKFEDGYKMNFWASYPAKMLVPESETEIIARLKRLITTHPVRQWTDVLTLENGGWQGLPRSYIHCVGQTYHKSSERMVAPAREPGWNFLEMNIPRNGMMTHPKLLADTFEQIALS